MQKGLFSAVIYILGIGSHLILSLLTPFYTKIKKLTRLSLTIFVYTFYNRFCPIIIVDNKIPDNLYQKQAYSFFILFSGDGQEAIDNECLILENEMLYKSDCDVAPAPGYHAVCEYPLYDNGVSRKY